MMMQLFFQQTRRVYFLVVSENENLRCGLCDKKICVADSVIIHRKFFTHKEFLFCEKCFKNEQEAFDSVVVALVSEVVPSGCIIVPFEPPLLGRSTTVWQAAVSNDGIKSDTSSVIIKDRTVFARDPFQSIMIAEKPKLLIDELPRLPKEQAGIEAARFFRNVKEMLPVGKGEFEALVYKASGEELRLVQGEVRKAVLLGRSREDE